MNCKAFVFIAASMLLTGCASIVNGTQQSISVVAKTPDAQSVIGARCALSNTKGDWFTTTPGSVTVHRGYGVLTVKCDHPAWIGELEAKSTTKPMAFGNLIFGGAIGVTVDIANGSAYDYPQLITVPMQSKTAVESAQAPISATPVSSPPAPAQGMPAASAPPQAVVRSVDVAAPPAPKAAVGPKPGQDGYSAERLARERSCAVQPIATLIAKGPGFESYSVACSNGEALAIRCEFGNCRVLQ